MARNKQLIRALKLTLIDRRKAVDLKALAKKMKVHVKTIRRDLIALTSVGIVLKIKKAKS